MVDYRLFPGTSGLLISTALLRTSKCFRAHVRQMLLSSPHFSAARKWTFALMGPVLMSRRREKISPESLVFHISFDRGMMNFMTDAIGF